MSPEAKDIFRKVKDLMIDNLASEETLESGMKKFLAGDITAEELQKLTRLREALVNESEDTFTPILEKFGLANYDFPITVKILERIEELVRPAEALPEIRAKKPRKSPWLANTSAMIIERLLETKKGKFLYQDISEIGRSCLNPSFKGKELTERKIKHRVYGERESHKKNINEVLEEITKAKDTEVKTMGELVLFMCDALPGPPMADSCDKVRNKAWRKVWKKILDDFGNLSPDDFFEKVLYAKRTGEIEKPVSPPKKDKIRPGEVIKNPIIEIILANKFSDAQVIEKIGEKVFEGVSAEQIMEIAKKQGWQVRGKDYSKIFERSCRNAAKERKNKQIDEKEGLEGKTAIINVIRRFTRKQGRAGWHTVESASHRPALRFLYALMGEVGGDASKADSLTEVLFSGFIGTIAKSGQVTYERQQ